MRADHFYWFDAETVLKLRDQLNRAGDKLRLEVHEVGGKLWLHVVPDGIGDVAQVLGAELDGFQPLNKSYLCPPSCP